MTPSCFIYVGHQGTRRRGPGRRYRRTPAPRSRWPRRSSSQNFAISAKNSLSPSHATKRRAIQRMPPMSCAHHVRTAHALTGHDRSTMSSSSTPRSTTEKGALAPEPVKVVRVPPFALFSYNANIETRSRGGGVSLSSGGRAVSAPLRYSAAGGGRSTRFRTKRRAFFVMVSLAGRRRRSVVRSKKRGKSVVIELWQS